MNSGLPLIRPPLNPISPTPTLTGLLPLSTIAAKTSDSYNNKSKMGVLLSKKNLRVEKIMVFRQVKGCGIAVAIGLSIGKVAA